MIRRYLHILSCLCLPMWLAAQDPYFRRIDESDGLPSNSIYGMHQDRQGFMWIATDDGLCRYDGHSFRRFTSQSQTSRSGANIMEDKHGRIWYENFDGQLYYVSGDSLMALKQDGPPGFRRAGILGDRLYVPRFPVVEVYDIGSLKPVDTISNGVGGQLGGVGNMGQQYYWLNGGPEWCYVDAKGILHCLSEEPPNPEAGIAAKRHTGTAFDLGGAYYSLDYDNRGQALFRWDGGKFVPWGQTFGKGLLQQHALLDGKVWICYNRGMDVMDPSTGKSVTGRLVFPNESISMVFRDHEGNYWFGTKNEGILFVADFNSRCLPGVDGIGIRRVTNSPLGLLVGTEDGRLLRLDSTTNQMVPMYQGTNGHGIDFLYADSELLAIGAPIGTIWALPGMRELPPTKSAFKAGLRLDHKYIALCCPASSGLYCYAPSGSPSIWDSTHFASLNIDNPNLSEILSGRGRAVAYSAADNCLYFGTSNGLMQVSPGSKREITWQGARIFASRLQLVGKGIYALTTLGRFLYISPTGEVTEPRGLPFAGPYRDLRYFDGKLYLLALGQLMQLTVDGPQVTPLNAIVGLESGSIQDICYYQGRLVLASRQGLIFLDPDQKALSLPPSLVITEFEVGSGLVDEDSLAEVSYRENTVRVAYSILNYRAGGNFPLYYRINDGDWRLADPDSRQLLLAELAPGAYELSFSVGLPSAKPTKTLRWRILSPFWQRPWFLVLCVLLLAIVVLAFVVWRNRVAARKATQRLEKLELENRLRNSTLTAIRSQMNPHFFFNALNTIQAFIFSDDKRSAAHYLGKFSKLTRMVLEMSEKEVVRLADEIEAITLYLELEKSRFGDDFQFQVEIGPGLNPQLIALPSMIIQPFVENAVKHGLLHKQGLRALRVAFHTEGETLQIEVDDNGIGRKRSAELNRIRQDRHASFSVNANQKRIDILNAGLNAIGVAYTDKVDAQGQALGTMVRITLRLQPYHSAT